MAVLLHNTRELSSLLYGKWLIVPYLVETQQNKTNMRRGMRTIITTYGYLLAIRSVRLLWRFSGPGINASATNTPLFESLPFFVAAKSLQT